jgi:hypothetical protein
MQAPVVTWPLINHQEAKKIAVWQYYRSSIAEGIVKN